MIGSHQFKFSIFLPLMLAVLLPQSVRGEEAFPDYARDIAPLLAKNCIACHNAKKSEGGLNLESHTALAAGGDSGAAIVPHKSSESTLLERVIDSDDPMPPTDNAVGAKALTPAEVELLKRWVDAGALTSNAPPPTVMNWQAIPEQLIPIYALDASRDGHYLAIGKGNTAQIVSLTEAQSTEPLIDPNLKIADGAPLLASHLDFVQSMAFSPDSQLLATGGYRTVKLWRRRTTSQQLLSGGSPGNVLSKFAPSGERWATVTNESGLELVDLTTGQAHRFLKSHSATISALTWLSDQHLLSADTTGQLLLTSADDHQTTYLKLVPAPATLVQFALSGERVFALDVVGKVFELQSESGESLLHAATTTEKIVTAQFVPLSEAATAIHTASQPQACLWVALKNQSVVSLAVEDLPKQTQSLRELKLDAPASRIEVSPDGQTLLTISPTGEAKLWKLGSGEMLAALDQDFSGSNLFHTRQHDAHRQSGLVELLVAQQPELQKASAAEQEALKKVQELRDQATAALATTDTELTTAQSAITDSEQALAAAQQRVTELTAEVEAKRKAAQEAEAKREAARTELAGREQTLVTAADGVRRAAQRIVALENQTAQERQRLASLESEVKALEASAHAPPALDGTFSADSQLAILAGNDHIVRLYQTANALPRANLAGASAQPWSLMGTMGNELRAVTADGRVLSWNLQLPWALDQTLGTPEDSPFSDRITALDFSPDGRLLAVGSGPPSRFGEVQLIDAASGAIAMNLGEVHSDTVLCLSFSPDGRQLASGGADKLCRLWQVDDGSALRTFEGHTHHVLGLAWHDNGQRLVTAGADQTVKVWKVESGEQQRTLSGFGHEVTAVEFVTETAQLISVAANGTAKLMNCDDGKTIRDYAGASDALYAVSISADGKLVTVGGQAGQVWTWNIETGELQKSSQAEQ